MSQNQNTQGAAQSWQEWRNLSDRLAVELAIANASRRIAAQYGR